MALLIELIKKASDDIVSAISIVDEPAILTHFLKFAEENRELQFAIEDEDKMEIVGPVLIPNVKIFRSGKSLGLDQDAYVYFSEDTIRELAYDFIGNSRNNETTLDHMDKSNDKFMMLESWLIEDPKSDKATKLGFELPKGTWMAKYKVKDKELWNQVKDGNYNGFSVEVQTTLVPIGEISLSDEDEREVLLDELHKPVLSHLNKNGIKQSDFEKEGWELFVDGDELTEVGEKSALLLAIISNADDISSLDRGNYAIRYKYEGPRDSKNRKFCADVLDADLIYRKEDIMQGTNPEFGTYNLFEFKGSYGCRHKFKRLVFVKTNNPVGNTEVDGYRPVPKSDLPNSYVPNDKDATTLNKNL